MNSEEKIDAEGSGNVAGNSVDAGGSAANGGGIARDDDVKPTENSEGGEKKNGEEKTKRPPVPFVHLHVHSEFSLLDGAARIAQGKESPLVERLKELDMSACALTDHGNMFGVYTFYRKAVAKGIKPIIGSEFYVCDDMHKQVRNMNHLILLAKNNTGYYNLVKMSSLSYTEGFYYKPRIDIELLKQHTEGVICLSACLAGKIPQLLVAEQYEQAKEYALMLKGMFAEGDFYIELQDHGIEEQRAINPLLVKIAREIGVKTVATNDVHYLKKSDAEMHDVLLCIQTGKLLDDPMRLKFDSDNFYLKSYEEMSALFSWCPEAVTNTVEVAEKCNVVIEKHDLYPPYKPEDGSTPEEFLRKLAYEGLKERYGVITDEIRERAEMELGVIIRTGFAEYYLIVWDFINFARGQGIPVGAGRGSGVGSIIAYAIRITNVEPLRFNLLFERFLNPERVSPPDFDIDFCMDRRGEVIEYVTRKYGSDKVCQILALGTMKAKGAIKDVARAYNVPLDKVNKTTKPISNAPGVTLEKVLGNIDQSKAEEESKFICPEVIDIYNNDPEMHRIIEMAKRLEGMPRNCSKHAAGVVICREVISDFVPLQKKDNDITTQFQKEEVEELGLLKMDFLGLTTLTDISKAKQYVRENTGEDIDFEKLGYEDPEVFKLIGSGDTDAVFQLESGGMKNFMADLQPESLEDIIAGISLYRPGPMDSIGQYVENKHHPDKIVYAHPLLEPILHMTYGVLVYQEQVMQIVQSLAGYTLGRADELRRAMGKKKTAIMDAEKEVFINGCPASPEVRDADGRVIKKAVKAVDGALKRGVSIQVATDIFELMAKFAKYAFNKSHAAAYAVLAYETAYLKRYHLVEFIAAIINDRITNAKDIAKYMSYLKACGVTLLPPDVNKSDVIFRAQEGGIRYGLGGIKNVGEAAMKLLVEERKVNGEYKSPGDMLARLPSGTINKKIFEYLIKSGALDCFGHTRASLMAGYEQLMARHAADKKAAADGQLSLFDCMGDYGVADDELPDMAEFDKNKRLAMEKEALSIYMSGHPLEDFTEDIKKMPYNLAFLKDVNIGDDEEGEGDEDGVSDEALKRQRYESVRKQYDNKEIKIIAVMSDITKKTISKGKSMGQLMATLKLEDIYNETECVIFSRDLERLGERLVEDSIVLATVRVNFAPKFGMQLRAVEPWTGFDKPSDAPSAPQAPPMQSGDVAMSEAAVRKLYVKITDRRQTERLKKLFEQFPGEMVVYLQENGKLFVMNGVKVADDEIFIGRVKAVVGKDCVKIG